MYSIDDNVIYLTRGDTFLAEISLKRNGSAYTPVAGDSIRFAMKKKFTSEEVLINKNIPIDTLVLRLDPADTKTLAFGDYVYDIQDRKSVV